MASKKFLIVNSDDYNLTEGVSSGIAFCFNNGIVTSTTFMSNLPLLQNSIALLRENGVSPGIHFNFTFGSPVSNPDLLKGIVDDDGKFVRSFRNIARRSMREQILMELNAQYDRFLSTGLKPSHFDSHHHVHTIPELRDIFFEFSLEKGLPLRSLDGIHREEAKSRNIITPQYFFDDFYGEKASLETLDRIFRNLPSGVSEIMCHPGYADVHLYEASSYTDSREKELEVLTSSEVKELIEKYEIELIGFCELADLYG